MASEALVPEIEVSEVKMTLASLVHEVDIYPEQKRRFLRPRMFSCVTRRCF